MSIQPNDAFLLDGVRTPFGKYRGALGAMSSLDLGQHAIEEVIRRQPLAAKPSAPRYLPKGVRTPSSRKASFG